MKRFILATLAALLACLACLAAPQTKKFEVKGKVTALSVANNIEVLYTVAPTVEVKAQATPEVMAGLKVELKNGILSFRYQGKEEKNTIKIYLKAPAVSGIEVMGNAEVKTNQAISGEKVKLQISGNGEIKLGGISAARIDVDASGNGELSVSDVICEDFNAGLSGNAEASIRTVTGNKLVVNASGNAEFDADVVTMTHVEAGASGNAQIELAGHASQVQYGASGNAVIDANGLVANTGQAKASGNSTIKCKVQSLQQQCDSELATIKNAR